MRRRLTGGCAGKMTAYWIIYLGSTEWASGYLAQLENSPCCARLSRLALAPPEHLPGPADLVLFEAPADAGCGHDSGRLVQALKHYPLVALTDRQHEHRGISAMRMGAQGFLCIDDTNDEEQEAVFLHARRRHRLLARLSGADANILSILKSINDGVIVVDRSGHVLDINPAARTILGLPLRAAPGIDRDTDFLCIAGDGRTRMADEQLPLARARRGEKFSDLVAVHRAPGQPDTLLSINGQGLYDHNRELAGGVITFRDVTDVTRRTLALERCAQYDELTGLANRSLFLRQLEKAAGRARRRGSSIAVLFIDLDRFKSVNDTLGHDAGDELLRQVAGRLSRHLRIGDMSGRWGGDEFVVCLEDFGESQNAAAAAQKLVLALSEKYELRASEVFATPSIGIALYPDSGDDVERVVKAADLAMYQAKKRGGGRFQFYSEALNAKLAQREELELGLRHALVRREFVLHYQPRIEVGSGRLIGLEALLRWQHPRYGLLPPARFLPILEASGLIHSAGEWVLDTGCRQLAAWQHEFDLPDLSLAINLSPQQLLHGRLIEAVSRSLSCTALDPGCIELEIGDGNIVRGRSAEYETLQGLRALGVRLSLDHFGTNDISFRSLDTGVIDSFVLDQSLIQDVTENGTHQRIVRAAIAMARGLDIEVAAEGVETVSQLEFLQSCDCDLAQGFLISRPMQADKVSAVLRNEIAGTKLLARA